MFFKLFNPMSTCHLMDSWASMDRYLHLREAMIRTAKRKEDVIYMMLIAFDESHLTEPDMQMEKIDKVFHMGFDFTFSEKWNLVRLAYASRWVESSKCEE